MLPRLPLSLSSGVLALTVSALLAGGCASAQPVKIDSLANPKAATPESASAAPARPKITEDLPPPEMTETWTPVPPVVTAPEGGIPSDAIVLFDGKNLDAWEPIRPNGNRWKLEDGAMVIVPNPQPCDQKTKQAFGDIQLHIEWRSPAEVKGTSQGRGNSGIFFMGLYELQVLDSYENKTYVNGMAGSIYKQHIPQVNASRPPGVWQTYDAVFIAPRFAPDGRLLSPARVTCFHNGVLVLHDVELKGPTVYRGVPKYEPHPLQLPLVLQDHRNPVAYRNIWVRGVNPPEIR